MNVMRKSIHSSGNAALEGNVLYSILLTLSTYLVPLVVFPYISRVIGPSGVGAIDATDYAINYFIQFSMMGLSTVGVREIAMARGDRDRLNSVFSSLFFLNLMLTLLAMAVLSVLLFVIPSFTDKRELYFVGMLKLLSNVFLVEWLFRGFEQFRYITIRSIIVRVLFIVAVFCVVHDKDDILLYYLLFVSMTVANSILNWNRRRGMVSLELSAANLRKYAPSFFLLGLFSILTSVYIYLNAVFLDAAAGDVQVGYYTTSTRLYYVVMALVTSVTTVLVPRLSSLNEQGNRQKAEELVDRMFTLLFLFSIPTIVFFLFSASDIVVLFAGSEFLPAAGPMRIVMLQILVIGIEQIVIIQTMVPNKMDFEPVIAAASGAAVSITANCLLLSRLGAYGAALSWLMAELTTMTVALIIVRKKMNFRFPIVQFLKILLLSVPYVLICFASQRLSDNVTVKIVSEIVLSAAYFIFLDICVIKTRLLARMYDVFRK